MHLELECVYTVQADGPLADTAGSAFGRTRYWRIHDGALAGPRIKARQIMEGSDWLQVGDDGFWRPDVRLPFLTDKGATVLLHYTGLVEQTETFKAAARDDRATDFADQYLRMSMRFETSDPACRWLTQSLFIARGRLLGTGRMEYEIFRVA